MKTKIINYIKGWEKRGYPDGIPDECHPDIERHKLAPSYRRICIAIMKNDVQLQSLGFTRQKCFYYTLLKKEEIAQRQLQK